MIDASATQAAARCVKPEQGKAERAGLERLDVLALLMSDASMDAIDPLEISWRHSRPVVKPVDLRNARHPKCLTNARADSSVSLGPAGSLLAALVYPFEVVEWGWDGAGRLP